MIKDRRIKVAVIGHVSNEGIRKHLSFNNPFLENSVRHLFGRHKKHFDDIAPWNTFMLDEFSRFEDLEVHMISPHADLRNSLEEYCEDGIYYHFYKSELAFPLNIIESKVNPRQYTEFPRTRKLVKGILERIKPDVVNLVGSENPYYSITGLDITGIPILLTVQTVYSNPNRKALTGEFSEYRSSIEKQLFGRIKYYTCAGRMYYDLLNQFVNNPIIFPLQFPRGPLPKVNDVPYEYDFAFWARELIVSKGINNALTALSIVKKTHPNVSLLVVGMCKPDFMESLLKQVDELDLSSNVHFHDFFASHNEMLQFVKRARYALLPIKMDVISGTVIEAMKIGMPVVTNITSGTPTLNRDRETVLLSPINDDLALANNMLKIMSSPQLAKELCKNGKIYIDQHFNSRDNARKIADQYHLVYEHYYNNTPIPTSELFNPNDYPICQ